MANALPDLERQFGLFFKKGKVLGYTDKKDNCRYYELDNPDLTEEDPSTVYSLYLGRRRNLKTGNLDYVILRLDAVTPTGKIKTVRTYDENI